VSGLTLPVGEVPHTLSACRDRFDICMYFRNISILYACNSGIDLEHPDLVNTDTPILTTPMAIS
jgi:hypothetical protein